MQSPPTASELAILQLLWDNGPLTVRQVHDTVAEERDVGYTTTLKTMQVMFERGFLTREPQGRGHLYAAAIAKEDTQDKLLDNFLDRAFGGSVKGLVMRALGNRKTSRKDIKELKALIDRLENEDQ